MIPRLRMLRVRRYTTFRIAMNLRQRVPGHLDLSNPPAFFLRWWP